MSTEAELAVITLCPEGFNKRRDLDLHGEAVERGELLSVERLFRGEEVLDPRDERSEAPENELLHQVSHWDSQVATWFSHTYGNPHPLIAGTSGLVLEVRGGPDTRFRFDVNDRRFAYDLAELLEGSRRESMRGWLSEIFYLHRAVPEEQLEARLDIVDDTPEQEIDNYYVRVAQENGQWAWSSPIWVGRR